MITSTVQFVDHTQRVKEAAEKATYKNLGHAAASIRKRAIESIVPAEGPSAPGTPPHTRPGRVSKKTGKARPGQLQRAIVYKQDRAAQDVVVGPRHSVVGESAKAHEFGGAYRDETFPERPFMGPALDQNLDRFGPSFAGSIGT